MANRMHLLLTSALVSKLHVEADIPSDIFMLELADKFRMSAISKIVGRDLMVPDLSSHNASMQLQYP